MKKILAVIRFSMVLVLIAYFTLDSQLYYCGKSRYNFYNKLPLKIQPQYWDYNNGNLGFVLVDEAEMTLVAKGDCQYSLSGKTITVKDIIKYGYTNEELVAQVQDTTGKKYFIEFLKNNDTNSKQDMIINILDDSLGIDYDKYKWVEVEDEYFMNEEEQRAYLARIFAVLVLGLFVVFLVLLKREMYSSQSQD
jgi:hypothetical protein